MKNTKKQSGFTLVELAIVLVIIGLIVGGVLAGSDLIKAATTQKAVKQINDINTGANTFRTKYNDLPGDLKNPALVFGGASSTISGSNASFRGQGDGNGFVDATANAGGDMTTTLGVSGEVGIFFYEMAQAGYIKESISGATNASNVTMSALTMTPAEFTTSFQPTALGKNSYFVVSAGPVDAATNNGKNYVTVVGAPPSGTNASGGKFTNFAAGLVPTDAASIDGKLDDSNPTTGTVQSIAIASPIPGTTANGAALASAVDGTNCYDTGSSAYISTFAKQSCTISIRASF